MQTLDHLNMNTREEKMEAFGRLLDIMDDLRAKCPWDMKQTMSSLRMLTIEEVYELSDAILMKNATEIREEIGDLMLHLVFYAKIAEESGDFDIKDALEAVCTKLINRHPHIYGNLEVADADEVKKNWEQIKLAEGKKSVLSGVPQGLPAMIKAYRMQEKTAQVGFEWQNVEDVWTKVMEEIQEFQFEMERGHLDKAADEFGDILFSLINYARYQGIDPETALENVNIKFKKRFEFIEQHAPRPLVDMSLSEMDALWDKAKKSLSTP